MGLDQYAYVVMPSGENTDFSVKWDWNDTSKVQLISQWRKHANLQQYMEDLYIKKSQEQGRVVHTNLEFKPELGQFSAQILDTETGSVRGMEEVFSDHKLREQFENDVLERIKEEFGKMNVTDFNQQPLRLSLDDLNQLELLVKEDSLPVGHGPFWGESIPEQLEETLKFIVYARRCLLEGLEVYYSSWW